MFLLFKDTGNYSKLTSSFFIQLYCTVRYKALPNKVDRVLGFFSRSSELGLPHAPYPQASVFPPTPPPLGSGEGYTLA
jgi:hypothetical protein